MTAAKIPYSGEWSEVELCKLWAQFESAHPRAFAGWVFLHTELKSKLASRPEQYNDEYKRRQASIRYFIMDDVLNESEFEVEDRFDYRRRRVLLADDMLFYFANELDNPSYLDSKSHR